MGARSIASMLEAYLSKHTNTEDLPEHVGLMLSYELNCMVQAKSDEAQPELTQTLTNLANKLPDYAKLRTEIVGQLQLPPKTPPRALWIELYSLCTKYAVTEKCLKSKDLMELTAVNHTSNLGERLYGLERNHRLDNRLECRLSPAILKDNLANIRGMFALLVMYSGSINLSLNKSFALSSPAVIEINKAMSANPNLYVSVYPDTSCMDEETLIALANLIKEHPRMVSIALNGSTSIKEEYIAQFMSIFPKDPESPAHVFIENDHYHLTSFQHMIISTMKAKGIAANIQPSNWPNLDADLKKMLGQDSKVTNNNGSVHYSLRPTTAITLSSTPGTTFNPRPGSNPSENNNTKKSRDCILY